MIEFESSVKIARSPDQVFAILADFEAYLARWADGPVAARRTEGDGGAGTRFEITARVGPLRVRAPYEITEYEPPARLGGRGTAGPVNFDEVYSLAVEGPATLVTQVIHAQPRGPFRLLQGIVERQLRRLIAADLARLKGLVETEMADETTQRP